MSAGKLAHGHREDVYLMANVRHMLSRRYRSMPNWVVAMDLFATGSTSAHQICYDAGIDPDGKHVDISKAVKTLADRSVA